MVDWKRLTKLGSLGSEVPTLTMDDDGFTRTWTTDAKALHCAWVDCGPFEVRPVGAQAPEVGIVWTYNGRAEWMTSRVVEAREIGQLVAEMNQRRDAALARDARS